MSKLEIDVCDHCGKDIRDFYASKGHVEIDNSVNNRISITVSTGRRKSGESKVTGFYSGKTLVFCNITCLTEFIHDLQKKAEENEEKKHNRRGCM